MVAENTTKNANFIRIVTILRSLRDNGSITEREYIRAKKYYLNSPARILCWLGNQNHEKSVELRNMGSTE